MGVGHLDQAPILFVGPNPSIAGSVPPTPAEATAPSHRITWQWTDEALFERFERAFDDYIVGGTRDIGATKATKYWSSIRRRAMELIPSRPVRPGIDYALTEAARCKSRKQVGVPDAVTNCVPAYLDETIALSAAIVVVALGVHARRALIDLYSLAGAEVEMVSAGGAERLITFLPHPNARGLPKRFSENLSPGGIAQIQARLAEE